MALPVTTHVRLRTESSRRLPDPVLDGAERQTLTVRADRVPDGLIPDPELSPNPRSADTNKKVYKSVKASLLGTDGSDAPFHLKHKGITVIAQEIRKIAEDIYELVLRPTDGIVDGGHSYTLIREVLSNKQALSPEEVESLENQYVRIDVLVGVPDTLAAEIAGGLNTAVQVQAKSLANLADKFDWIKDVIKDESYAGRIGWEENADGDVDVSELLAMLYVMNTELFPADGPTPIAAYNSKQVVIEKYLASHASFVKMAPLVKDIFTLYDIISCEAQGLYNTGGRKFASLKIAETRKRGEFSFVFLNKTGKVRLRSVAVLPILAAFRTCIVKDANGVLAWDGGFAAVLDLWRSNGGQLVSKVQENSEQVNQSLPNLGKSKVMWDSLYTLVELAQLRRSKRV